MISKRLHPASFSNVNAQLAQIPSHVGCKAYHNADQSIANATFTILALNSEVFDTDNMHDLTINNSRVICKTAGKYLVIGFVAFASNLAGVRMLELLKGGTHTVSQASENANPQTLHRLNAVGVVDLVVNDYLELRVWQNSGGSLNITYNAGVPYYLALIRIAA